MSEQAFYPEIYRAQSRSANQPLEPGVRESAQYERHIAVSKLSAACFKNKKMLNEKLTVTSDMNGWVPCGDDTSDGHRQPFNMSNLHRRLYY
jgi:hypothetical protein